MRLSQSRTVLDQKKQNGSTLREDKLDNLPCFTSFQTAHSFRPIDVLTFSVQCNDTNPFRLRMTVKQSLLSDVSPVQNNTCLPCFWITARTWHIFVQIQFYLLWKTTIWYIPSSHSCCTNFQSNVSIWYIRSSQNLLSVFLVQDTRMCLIHS